MAVSNSEIVRVLAELATLTKLEDGSPQSFRVRAYEAGIQTLPKPSVSQKAVRGLVRFRNRLLRPRKAKKDK